MSQKDFYNFRDLNRFVGSDLNNLKSITPHIPIGLISPDDLIIIGEVAKKYNAILRISSAQSITLSGISEEDFELVKSELEFLDKYNRNKSDSKYNSENKSSKEQFSVRSFQSVKTCRGKEFCKRGRQNAVTLGLKTDDLFYGTKLPSKLRVSISGCPFSCSEPKVCDIGIVGNNKGYNLFVGGNAGGNPRIGFLFKENLTEDEVLKYIDSIIMFLIKHDTKKRLGDLIELVGFDEFKTDVELFLKRI